MARLSFPLLVLIASLASHVQCTPCHKTVLNEIASPAQTTEPTPTPLYDEMKDLKKRQYDYDYDDPPISYSSAPLIEPTLSFEPAEPSVSAAPAASPADSEPAASRKPGLHVSSSPASQENGDFSSGGSGVPAGVIAGAVVGGFMFITLISTIIIFCCCKRRNARRAGGAGGAYAQPMVVYPPPARSPDQSQGPLQEYHGYFGQTPEPKGFASGRVSVVSAPTPSLFQHGEATQQSPLMGTYPASIQTTEYQGYQPEPPYHETLGPEQPQHPQSYYDPPIMSPPPSMNAPVPIRRP